MPTSEGSDGAAAPDAVAVDIPGEPAADNGNHSGEPQDELASENMPGPGNLANADVVTSETPEEQGPAQVGNNADALEAVNSDATAIAEDAILTAEDSSDSTEVTDAEDLPFEYTLERYVTAPGAPVQYTLTVTSTKTTDLVIPAEVDGIAITRVIASGLGLTSIDVSACSSLRYLDCSDNMLTSLDVSEVTLSTLDCSNNELTSLTGLYGGGEYGTLNCSNNHLTSLVIPYYYGYLYCNDNELTELSWGTEEAERVHPFSSFDCSNNNLSGSLSVSGQTIRCSGNNFTILNADMRRVNSVPCVLDCSDNQLAELNVTSNGQVISYFDCSNNQLVSLDVTDCMIDLNQDTSSYDWWLEYGDGFLFDCSNNRIVDVDIAAIDAWAATQEERGLYTVSTGNQNVPSETDVVIDETTFPDEAFRGAVSQYDADGDGYLSEEECARVTDLGDLYQLGVSLTSLDGIENFPNVTNLCIENTGVTELDTALLPKLQHLRCYGTGIAELDLSVCPNIRTVYCNDTPLQTLALGDSPDLQMLDCSNTEISSLDVSGCPNLRFLGCSDTNLTSLDLSNVAGLYQLNCASTGITSLNLGGTEKLGLLGCPVEALASFEVDELQDIVLMQLSGETDGLDLSVYGKLGEVSFVDGTDSMAWLVVSDGAAVWVGARSSVSAEGEWHFGDLGANENDGERVTDLYSSISLAVTASELESGSIDLAKYFPGIEAARISNVQGATINGTVLSGIGSESETEAGIAPMALFALAADDASGNATVSYTYDCGTSADGPVTLNVTLSLQADSSEEPVDPVTPVEPEDPDTPVAPEDPVTPEGPTSPETPTTPGADEPANTPAKPDNPGTVKPGGNAGTKNELPKTTDLTSTAAGPLAAAGAGLAVAGASLMAFLRRGKRAE